MPILPNLKTLEISQPKFQQFYNCKRYDFSPNFKDVGQKLGPTAHGKFYTFFAENPNFEHL